MLYIPRLRRITDVLNEMHEQDPFGIMNRHIMERLLWNKKITAIKYGDAWLINIDELYNYFSYNGSKTHKQHLPLGKNMMTSGQIVNLFIESDPNTIIRQPNLRRYCIANNVNMVISSFLYKPLYDFNDFLMKVNPKGINHIVEMPILRSNEMAINEIRANHFDQIDLITDDLAKQILTEGEIYKERYGKNWMVNYCEYEESIIKALQEKQFLHKR